jgi:hypothetical protein
VRITRSVREIALAFQAAQARRTRLTANEVQRLWAQLDRRDLSGSWDASVGPRIVRAITAGQLSAAAGADGYVDEVVDAEGADPARAGRVRPEAFAGVAADGRSLDSLMLLSVITTKQGIAGGLSEDDALMRGLNQALRLSSSEVAQAGRSAVGSSMTGVRTIQGYVRVVQPPACARCIILAGTEYGWNKGFQRHPRCFPAGVVVSGPPNLAAARRWYQGELVVLTTASGQELPVTGNHPVLTDRGWLPANLIQEGDHVVRSALSQGAVPLVVPDERQVPARIEDLWRPSGVMPLLQMPATAEDFHGDGGHGDVDVVLTDGLLRQWGEASLGEPLGELALSFGVVAAALLSQHGASFEGFEALLGAANGVMGRSGLGGSLFGAHLGGADLASLGVAPSLYASFGQPARDDVPTDSILLSQGVLAGPGHVGGDDLVGGQGGESGVGRWDPAGSYRSPESVSSYARLGGGLRDRLSGQVELDCVVELRRVQWSGHVYNLTSSEGWYSANGLIVSNCDCVHLPTTLIARHQHRDRGFIDPNAYFSSLGRAEQDRVFTAAGARAIREGGDMGQIVNARRGMYTTTAFGRTLRATREGTTTRGFFYRQERARDIARGRVPADIGRQYRLTTPRLLPEQIFELAESRDEAIAMLRRFGYLS